MKRMFRRGLPGIPALVFLLLFFISPLLFIFAGAFLDPSGSVSARQLFELLSRPRIYAILRFTLLQAGLSVLVSLLLGLPGAWILARYRFPGRQLLLSLSIIPFILPPVLVVLGFIAVFGNNGMLNLLLMRLFSLEKPPLPILYSLQGIILAHGFYNFPVVLRINAAALLALPRREEEAAMLMGASAPYRFRTLILPRLLPSLVTSMLMVFLFCFSSFAVVLVLGGGPAHSTLEVEIYRLARIRLDMAGAGLLALLSAAISMVPLIFLPRGGRMALSELFSDDRGRLATPSRWTQAGAFLYSLVMLLFVMLPIAAIAIHAFTDSSSGPAGGGFTLSWFLQLFSTGTGEAVAGTLLLGSMSLLITIPLATGAAFARARGGTFWRSSFSFLATLPMSISSVILGAGYLALSRFFSLSPGGTGANIFLIALSHSVIAFPFVFHTISSSIGPERSNSGKAAITLGASPVRSFFDVELPGMEPALFSAAAFCFALSAGEMNATLTFSGGSVQTIPIAIYRLIGAYRYHQASALGVILIVVSATAFLFLDRSRKQ